ncbi:hypothetical protein Trydic_g6994 [Trypoxylus dichotomus]
MLASLSLRQHFLNSLESSQTLPDNFEFMYERESLQRKGLVRINAHVTIEPPRINNLHHHREPVCGPGLSSTLRQREMKVRDGEIAAVDDERQGRKVHEDGGWRKRRRRP